jgi:hypothetical protein
MIPAGSAASLCPYGHRPGYCIAQNTTLSGSIGADGMASVIAHELAEAVSDPLVGGDDIQVLQL